MRRHQDRFTQEPQLGWGLGPPSQGSSLHDQDARDQTGTTTKGLSSAVSRYMQARHHGDDDVGVATWVVHEMPTQKNTTATAIVARKRTHGLRAINVISSVRPVITVSIITICT